MQSNQFRSVFTLVLALVAFCAMLWTVTMMVDYPGGIALTFREVVCAGVTVGVLAILALDLFGIWTGHLPTWRRR